MMKLRTKSQVHADLVFKKIQAFLECHEMKSDVVKGYRTLATGSGGMVRTVGLIQYLTYLKAKSKDKDKVDPYTTLLEHLQQELSDLGVVESSSPDDLLSAIREQSLTDYMVATSEVLKLLRWHKQIVESLVIDESEGE